MAARIACLVSLLVLTPLRAQPRTDEHGDPLPSRALARLGTTKPQHVWNVSAVAYAPDGKTVASCDSQTVRLWDVATGRQLQLHRNASDKRSRASNEELAFSPDGKWLAVGGEHGASIYDVAAAKLHRQLEHDRVRRLCFTPDGRTLLTGDYHTPKQWDTATGDLVRTFPRVEGIETTIGTIAAAPNGKSMLLIDSYGRASWWDLGTGKPTRRLSLDCGGVRTVVAPNGKWVVGGIGDEKLGCIDLATGNTIRIFPDGDWRIRPRISADSETLVGFEKGKLCFWRLATREKVTEMARPHEYMARMSLAPDGKTFASADGCQIFITDVATGKNRQTIGAKPESVASVSFTPDGKSGLVAYSAGDYDDPTRCQRWDLATGKLIGQPLELPRNGYCVCFDRHLLATRIDGDIALWDSVTGKKTQTLPTGGDPRNPMCFSPDQTLFAAFFYSRTNRRRDPQSVRVWQAGTGKEVRTLDVTDMAMHTFTFAPDGESLAMACGHWRREEKPRVQLVHWDLKTGKLRSRPLHDLIGPTALALSPDGRLLAVSSTHSDCISFYLGIFVYEVASGRLLWASGSGRDRSWFNDHVRFSRDGRSLMAVQGPDVKFWDATTGELRGSLKGHEQYVTRMALSPDGRTLLTGGADTTVVHWDIADLVKPAPIKARSLTKSELSACWKALGEQDPVGAYRSIGELCASPAQAVDWLREHLKAVCRADDATIARTISALDDPRYAAREKAAADLERCGGNVVPLLAKKLQEPISPEMRRRLEGLCAKMADLPAATDELYAVRGAAVLEEIGTKEARRLLQSLAAETRGAWLTNEAQSALRRLSKER